MLQYDVFAIISDAGTADETVHAYAATRSLAERIREDLPASARDSHSRFEIVEQQLAILESWEDWTARKSQQEFNKVWDRLSIPEREAVLRYFRPRDPLVPVTGRAACEGAD
jgi:hypothetical protein